MKKNRSGRRMFTVDLAGVRSAAKLHDALAAARGLRAVCVDALDESVMSFDECATATRGRIFATVSGRIKNCGTIFSSIYPLAQKGQFSV